MADHEHSPLGASGAARWLACPGSFSLIQKHGREEESEYAALGTAAHTLAATCLADGRDAWEYTGQTFDGFEIAEGDNKIDPIAVQVYLDFVRDMSEQSDFVMVESPIGKTYKPNPYFWGTVDFAAKVGGVLHVADFKYGQGVDVEAAGSPQLMYYAFGLLNEISVDGPETEVHLHIVQPRAPVGDPVRTWVTTAGFVRQWAEEVLLPGMEKAAAGSDEFNTGDHCRFCPAKLYCPAMKEAFEAVATASEDVSDEELDALYVKAQAARMFMKALDARLMARLIEGGKFQNVKLVRKRSTRTWKDDAPEKLVALLGDDAYERTLLSPAKAEKISDRLKAFVAENAFLPPAEGYSLAAASDPKPGVDPAADLAREFAHYRPE